MSDGVGLWNIAMMQNNTFFVFDNLEIWTQHAEIKYQNTFLRVGLEEYY